VQPFVGFGRAALSDLALSRPEAVPTVVPSALGYCTREWVASRSPSADSNRSRWPVDPRWEAVHPAPVAHAATERLRFIRDRTRATSLASPRQLPGSFEGLPAATASNRDVRVGLPGFEPETLSFRTEIMLKPSDPARSSQPIAAVQNPCLPAESLAVADRHNPSDPSGSHQNRARLHAPLSSLRVPAACRKASRMEPSLRWHAFKGLGWEHPDLPLPLPATRARRCN